MIINKNVHSTGYGKLLVNNAQILAKNQGFEKVSCY